MQTYFGPETLEGISKVIAEKCNIEVLNFQFLERSRLDPNDPRNAELLHLVESIPSTTEKDCYFRLVAVDEAERFVNDKEFDRNRRFAVLKMREEGVSSKKLAMFKGGFTIHYVIEWVL